MERIYEELFKIIWNLIISKWRGFILRQRDYQIICFFNKFEKNVSPVVFSNYLSYLYCYCETNLSNNAFETSKKTVKFTVEFLYTLYTWKWKSTPLSFWNSVKIHKIMYNNEILYLKINSCSINLKIFC